MDRHLAEIPEGSELSRQQRIVRVLADLAEQGDLRAIEIILRRVWPEKLSVQQQAAGEGPLVVLKDYTGLRLNRPEERIVESVPPSEPGAIPEQAPKAEPATWSVRRPDDDDRPSGAAL